ncbi:MAG: thiamine pyrophosphate-binding protein, partial [Sciscionella sp.]
MSDGYSSSTSEQPSDESGEHLTRIATAQPNAAELMVACLHNEGVEYVFGIPGEENIRLTNALDDSPIRYILTRHEQAASFMAEMYGRVTGKAGVVSATLGPGAIN